MAKYPRVEIQQIEKLGISFKSGVARISFEVRKWTLLPRLEWVKDIVQAADGAGIPVFLKDNLYRLAMDRPAEDHDLYWEDMSTLKQELPDRRVAV